MAGKVRISKEYKDHPSGEYRVKRVNCDGKFYGEIREYKRRDASGRPIRIYWAARQKGEYVEKRIAWAFDKLMVGKFAEEGIPITHIGVLVTADGNRRINKPELIEEKWLTRWDTFRKYREDGWNYTGKVGTAPGAKGKEGSNQWALSFMHFKWLVKEVPEEAKLKAMKISGRK